MTLETYDYIVVGAGSAGCVLADRLSACRRYSVLLVEAGGSDQRFWIKTPLGYAKTFNDPRVNWRYTTPPDPGLNGRAAYWPRGRIIGGSSSINAMAYLRGLPNDFDDWERTGATGWNWETAQKTYRSIEMQSALNQDGTRKNTGDGPLWVSDVSDQMHPFSKNFLSAASEMGWTVSNNLNGEDTEGLMRMRSTVRDGRRWSAADAFLRPALTRKNLHVISNALVQKITFEQTRAKGIVFKIGETQNTVNARKEVIVSAGAVNSPQLLQLSGIGPADVLKKNGIDVVHHLSQVGQGLQDHLGISYFYHSNVPTLNNILGNWRGKMFAGMRYLLTKRGPLSIPVNQVSGFVRSNTDAKTADLQIYCNPMSYITNDSGQPGIDPKAGFLLCAQPCRPTSRGEINIASADPAQAPIIQPNSLSTNHDCDMAIKAGHVLKQLAQTPAIQAVTETRQTPDVTTMTDDQMLEDFRARAGTIFHPSCTCQMGESEQDSVLNARLQVHGINGLRVVDASAFPNITSGNTNAPVIMLAARAADLILEDANRTSQ